MEAIKKEEAWFGLMACIHSEKSLAAVSYYLELIILFYFYNEL